MTQPDKYTEIFTALSMPFDATEVKQRSAPGGRMLDYITARTVANRLDSVLGPENWWDSYIPGERSVLCKLSIELPNGKVVTKEDAGGFAGMADAGDDDMSGYSTALKRAAAKFGVGRYLYKDSQPQGGGYQQAAQPAPQRQNSPQPQRQASGQPSSGGGNYGKLPVTGRQFYPWAKGLEEQHGVSILAVVKKWGESHDSNWPFKSTDWNDDQTASATEFAVGMLNKHLGVAQEPDAPSPRRQAPSTPAGGVDAARKAATQAIWKFAKHVKPDAGNDDYFACLDKVSDLVSVATGGRTCHAEGFPAETDETLLRLYVQQAEVAIANDDIPF